MTADQTTEVLAQEMFQRLGYELREYRRAQRAEFTGLAYMSVAALQALVDDTALRDSRKYKRPMRRSKVHHGYQARMLGVRVVADNQLANGAVELRNR